MDKPISIEEARARLLEAKKAIEEDKIARSKELLSEISALTEKYRCRITAHIRIGEQIVEVPLVIIPLE